MGKYDSIINLPHPEPRNRQRMSVQNRAAQFSAFAALTGHSEAIKETERLTDCKIEPQQDAVEELNRKLMWIKDNIRLKPKAVIVYFVPDDKKSGGKYVTAAVNVLKIDEVNHALVTADGLTVAFHNILKIEQAGTVPE